MSIGEFLEGGMSRPGAQLNRQMLSFRWQRLG